MVSRKAFTDLYFRRLTEKVLDAILEIHVVDIAIYIINCISNIKPKRRSLN